MNAEVKKLWIEAISSGKYKKCCNILHSKGGGYCITGVLCDLHRKANKKRWRPTKMITAPTHIVMTYLDCAVCVPKAVMYWAEVSATQMNVLTERNDKGYSFEALMIWIKDNL